MELTSGRGSRIRTCGPLLPKRGQAILNQGPFQQLASCARHGASISWRWCWNAAKAPAKSSARPGSPRIRWLNLTKTADTDAGAKVCQVVADVAFEGVDNVSMGAISHMGQINTYDSAAEAEADKAQQKALLMALNAWDRALRRDEAGAWAISGKQGSIHTWGNGKCWVLYVSCNSGQHWTWAKKKLSFCSVTQDGDNEGCLRLRQLPTPERIGRSHTFA